MSLVRNKTLKLTSAIITLFIISGFSTANLTHKEAKTYQESIQNQGENKIQLNHLGYSKFEVNDDLDKQNINKTGILEINRFHNQIANKSQVNKAWNLYSDTYRNAKKKGWFNIGKGFKDSYFNSSISPSHYPNRKFLYDGRVLDPSKPEYLMYFEDEDTGQQKLLGVMFMTNKINETGPQIGGPLTRWHYHRFPSERCFENNVLNLGSKSLLNKNEKCRGSLSEISPEMLHVWFIERNRGPFSTNMKANAEDYPKIPDKYSKNEFKHKLWKSYPNELLQCKP